MNEIYYDYLLADGVPSDHIIKVSLDLKKWEALRNGDMLYHYISETIHDDELYYVFLDEIQLVEGFEEVERIISVPLQDVASPEGVVVKEPKNPEVIKHVSVDLNGYEYKEPKQFFHQFK